MTTKKIITDLGDNLILRRSVPEDAEALGKFNGTMHVDPGEDFVEHIDLWVKELLSGTHPTFHSDDFTIVEDTSTGEIVSSLCLIDQTWAYEGIPFPVGRPELVATHPDYRRRGLIRKQFEVVHGWSADRGHKLQFITGIPWYYRQFGYEMCVNLGGNRITFPVGIPKLKEDEEEPVTFREAAETDLPFISRVYNHSIKRSLLSTVRDEAIWHFTLFGRTPASTNHIKMQIIEDRSGKPVGYFSYPPTLRGGVFPITSFELAEDVSWLETTPALLRKALELGKKLAEAETSEDKQVELIAISSQFGEDHPSYHILPRSMPLTNKPYAFYMRVPDLPDFLQTIGPVLEERLAKSYAVGYSGEIKLKFYTDGAIMTFENGKLKAAEPWEPSQREDESAHFPDLTFLQLLFGYHSFDELNLTYPDCFCRPNEVRVLLRILFPKKISRVYDLG